MQRIYSIQPYKVGSRHGKSLVMVIPAKVVKQCDVNTSTVFVLQADEKTKTIVVRTINGIVDEYKKIMVPVGRKGFESSSNQQAQS